MGAAGFGADACDGDFAFQKFGGGAFCVECQNDVCLSGSSDIEVPAEGVEAADSGVVDRGDEDTVAVGATNGVDDVGEGGFRVGGEGVHGGAFCGVDLGERTAS